MVVYVALKNDVYKNKWSDILGFRSPTAKLKSFMQSRSILYNSTVHLENSGGGHLSIREQNLVQGLKSLGAV